MTTSPAPDKFLSGRVRTLRRAAAGVSSGDARAVHVARTTTRRLREAVPSLPTSSRRREKLLRRLRRLGRRLGAIRDLDVQLRHVEALLRRRGGAEPVLVALREELQRERRSCETVRLGARVTRLAARLARLRSRLAASSSAELHRTFARRVRRRAARRAARLDAAIVSAGTVYAPDRLHGVRIAAKQLRYALELMDDGPTTARMLQLLRVVQTALGAEHDTTVLIDRLRGTPLVAAGQGMIPVGLDALLEARCRRLHARFLLRRQALRMLCADVRRGRRLPVRSHTMGATT